MCVGLVWLLLALTPRPCLTEEIDPRPAATVVVHAPAPVVRASAPRAAAPVPAPLAMVEVARYRVAYGVLDIGEVRLSVDGPPAATGQVVRAAGEGEGAILGFGRLQNRVRAEFDSRRLDARAWTNARRRSGEATHDVGEQPRPGQLQLTRLRDGANLQRRQADVPGPAMDPVSFLLRLRISPPAAGGAAQVLYVLDGQALWRVTLTNAGQQPLPGGGGAGTAALRLEARADPIHYDGSPDVEGDRPPRGFSLWLSDDPARVPLRLQMPLGIADVVVALVDVQRRPR